MSVRLQVMVSDEMGDYLRSRAKEIGQSISSLCAFYIAEYIDQKKGLDSISKMMTEYEKQQKEKTDSN